MSKDAKNVPALRFKGYSDAWEKRKLTELSKNKIGGGTPSTKVLDFWNGKLPWLQSSDINESNNYSVKPQKFISLQALKHSAAKRVPANSIAVVTRVGVGKLALIEYDYSTSQDFLSFSSLNWSALFSVNLLTLIMTQMSRESQGTSIKGVTKSELLAKKVRIPISLKEQEKLGILMKSINDLIAATQDKIDALEQAKKALLQRLFDQSWRFKGYSDPWEKRKLGEVATITMGQSPDSKNYTLNPQDHILVQGNADIKNGWVEPRVWTTQITKIAKKGSVLLSVRAPVGEVSKTAFDVVLGRGVASVGQTDFLYQYLITLKISGFWLRYSTGSTFDSINSSDIKEAIIFLPKKNEQDRIAKTLNCIDNLIAATQSRLSSLELLKKYLLQDLFI
ncbi:restriction endonuclease subunit S [Lacticaseibacillus paracasei]|jgi:type I restriction enzyme, S subunit|uniref:Type IC specificity subunit protein n=1 Tax=Lacticaseibacillus paracasei subsp. paracasei Lpp49 TaxID=1256213 RepID=A0ABC9T9P4_LACPA|nr:restriction endonuclease subunit S [Lacticaseibacillus paracasei]EPC89722.1 type IC specificity subunit protein [Lacticaseibacillus paracasei subsp. paracasei Lpp49]